MAGILGKRQETNTGSGGGILKRKFEERISQNKVDIPVEPEPTEYTHYTAPPWKPLAPTTDFATENNIQSPEQFKPSKVETVLSKGLSGLKMKPIQPTTVYQYLSQMQDPRTRALVDSPLKEPVKLIATGEDENNYYYKGPFGNTLSVPKKYTTNAPPTQEMLDQLRLKAEGQFAEAEQNYPGYARAIDRFGQAAGSVMVGQNLLDQRSDTGNSVLNTALDVGGSILGFGFGQTPGMNQTLFNTSVTQTAPVSTALSSKTLPLINKLTQNPKAQGVLKNIADRTIRGAVESVPVTIQQGMEDKPKQLAKRAVTDAAIGAGLENVAGGIGDLVKNVKQARQLKKAGNTEVLPSNPKAGLEQPKTLPNKVVKSIDDEISELERSKNMLEFQGKMFSNKSNINRNEKSINELAKKINDLQAKKTSIPDDVMELKDFVKNLDDQQKKGIKVDLQLFAEAQEKLRKLERGFSKNIRTDSYINEDLRKSFDESPLDYEQLSNKATLGKAEEIFNKGFDEAITDWNRNLSNFRPEDVPLSKMLANQAVQNGNVELARQIISDTAEKLTRAGQFSQAARILRQGDAGASAIFIQKQIDKLNKDGLKRYGKKWKDIVLTDDDIMILDSMKGKSDFEKDKILEDIFNRISKQIPVTNMEKFDAWRRMAMLFNPKTHARNVMGNVIMKGLRKSSDALGAIMEKAARVPVGKRTKSITWKGDKELINIVEQNWQANKKDLLQEGRWDIDNLKFLNREKPIFKTKWLETLNQFSKKALDLEDVVFFKDAYKDSLGQYMKANKLKQVTKSAQEYAKNKALESTFKKTNMLSDFISKAKRKGGVVGKLTEAAIPFSKTPSNIAISAIDYSPVGLLKLLYSKGKEPAEIIETLSKGMTGTAIVGLGYLLSSLGWGRSEKNKSKNTEAILNQMGEQPYSVITPLGSYTFDWAQPFAVPLAMGMTIHEAIAKKDNVDAESIADAVATGGDTIFNLSMLKNIKDLLGGGFGSATEKIMGLPVSYVEQAFPTIFGQAARSIDPVRRSTYDPNPIKQFGREIAAKTPFLSKKLEPKLDVFGKEQKQNSILEQFFSPGYSKGKTDDPVTKEIVRLYKSTKETDILPKVAPYKFTKDGKEITLTPEQITEFQRKMGQYNYADISKEILKPNYKISTDENKRKLIRDKVSSNYDKVKDEILKKISN